MIRIIVALLWTINCHAMNEPRMNALERSASLRTAGPPTFARDGAHSTSSIQLENGPSHPNAWGSNRQELQVPPSNFLSPRLYELDRGALQRTARACDSIQCYRLHARPSGNPEDDVWPKPGGYRFIPSWPIHDESQDWTPGSSRILPPQDNMIVKGKDSDPAEIHTYNNQQSTPRPRKFIKLMGAFIEPEEQPSSSLESKHNSIINQSPPNLSSSPSSMTISSRHINTVNNQESDRFLVSEGTSEMSPLYQLPASILHHFTMNDPRHFPINNRGLIPSGKAMNAETRSGAGSEQISGHEEDESAQLLKFDRAAFAFPTPRGKDTKNLDIIFKMIDILQRQKLVISEHQFTHNYHGFFNKNYNETPSSNADKIESKAKTREISQRREELKSKSTEIIFKDQKVWCTHWQKKTNLDIHSLAKDTEASKSPEMHKLLIVYLFYIEMISTIIPRELDAEYKVGRQLENGASLFEELVLASTFAETQIMTRENLHAFNK
ncbi:hypothetical protein PTTG_26311 [Puccinia triticina 1-1 BBBD Race 1]|uniref:Uncharacterized protein n=2 Tax=Puccinia triticina TaxID=208348 RepID=A0A180GVE6_PUCT1|nr:uncharacterized protein PtA15_3A681 [Puccinia triticina]OAV96474.1 hypothetical protein PTTG_26311 [Puccinia triticina 1-1 BBBD Race 1]WAQ83312.1 hypothetical protein PtA15_3A681 [Puccinia triticina]